MAAAASLPVAKNLQSKPEIAEIPALDVDDGEDVIDGEQLPVGELAKTAGQSEEASRDAAIAATLAEAPKLSERPSKPRVKSGVKVPNFNKFRKKLFLIIGGGVLFVLFLIWAIFIAPHATIVITAKTTSSSVNQDVTIATSIKTSFDDSTIKATSNKQSQDASVDFTPTGKKDAGKKATGTVKLSKLTPQDITVPAGTKLTSSGGLVFTTDSAATVPASVPCFPTYCAQSATVSVTAAENGSKYNGADGSMSGAPSGVSAELTSPTSGGITKMVTVVTASDVQKAKEQMAQDADTDSIKSDLKSKFGNDVIVIDESFSINYTDVTSAPAVGDEIDSGGTATLTATVVYTLYAVEKSELSTFLDAYMKNELKDSTDQRVYKNGAEDASFQDVSKTKSGTKATLIATAQVGPKIDDGQVKKDAEGKRFGEIQQSLESIQGVEDVNVKFFPFWNNTVPTDPKRITVEFQLNES